MIHERRCHDCGNVADHEDNVTPYVNCKKCGSQDTRAIKSPKCSVAAEIAVAIAGIPYHDYKGICAAITKQLDRFGIRHLQTPKMQ